MRDKMTSRLAYKIEEAQRERKKKCITKPHHVHQECPFIHFKNEFLTAAQ